MMNQFPFPENHQLDDQLRLDHFKVPTELCKTLPGQPRVRLDKGELDGFLKKDLSLPELNRLAPWLWMVSTPRSSHISPLHHQAVRGRNITITENPQLHLVWYYNQIFIKPIPRYLLSYAFWQHLATQPSDIQEAAIGFMRTYSYLVCHESDFSLAQNKGLIPTNEPSNDRECLMSWTTFARLISSFETFGDETVSPRYSYGELRLTRLNFYSRIFLRKLTFHHINAQWGAFINSAIAPFIVLFGIISVVLNAMQVDLTVQNIDNIERSWAAFNTVSKWFSVFVLIIAMLVIVFIFLLTTFFFIHDICFARSILNGKKKNPQGGAWEKRKSGVV